jgi:hypothetical protein
MLCTFHAFTVMHSAIVGILVVDGMLFILGFNTIRDAEACGIASGAALRMNVHTRTRATSASASKPICTLWRHPSKNADTPVTPPLL